MYKKLNNLLLILFLLNKNFLIFGEAINQDNSFNKIKKKIETTQDKNETTENENDDKSQKNDKKNHNNQKQNNSLNKYNILNNVDNTTKKTKPINEQNNKKSKLILKNIEKKNYILWAPYILIFIIVIIILPVMFYKIYKSFKSFKLDINIKTPTKDLTISYDNGKTNKNIKFFKNKEEFDFVEKFIDSPLFKEFVKKNLSIKEARDNEKKKQDDFFDILKKYDKTADKKFKDDYYHMRSFSDIQYIYSCTNNANTIKIQFIYTISQHGNKHTYQICFSNLQNELIYQIKIINFNQKEFIYNNHTITNDDNSLQSFYYTDDKQGLCFYYNGKVLDIRNIRNWDVETDKNFIESIVLNSFKKIEKIMETTYNKQFFTNEKQ